MFKKLLTIIAIAVITSAYSQSFDYERWQLGIGGGLVKFSEADAEFIADKHLSQIPRFNVTRRINENFLIDAAISFGSFDSDVAFITTNNIPYLSLDISGRYHFYKRIEQLEPYVFIGGSYIDSPRRITPTLNVGAGITYWFLKRVGVSTNVYYKYALNTERMRSHFQFTLGVVFGLNFGKGNRKLGSARCYFDLYK